MKKTPSGISGKSEFNQHIPGWAVGTVWAGSAIKVGKTGGRGSEAKTKWQSINIPPLLYMKFSAKKIVFFSVFQKPKNNNHLGAER